MVTDFVRTSEEETTYFLLVFHKQSSRSGGPFERIDTSSRVTGQETTLSGKGKKGRLIKRTITNMTRS